MFSMLDTMRGSSSHNKSSPNQPLLNRTCPLSNGSSENQSLLNQFGVPFNGSYIASGNQSFSTTSQWFIWFIFTSIAIFLCGIYNRYRTSIIHKFLVFLSLHPLSKPFALLSTAILLIIAGAILLYIEGNSSWIDALWLSTSIVADAFNLNSLVGTASRTVSLIIHSSGLFIYACMMGMVSDAISYLFHYLRKGTSEVVEIHHTLILGWNETVGSLLQQLALANRSLGGGVIVVLSERDKEDMENDIAKLEYDFMGTSVICRSGNPGLLADLKKVSFSMARVIIVLTSYENDDEQSDARALGIAICLTSVANGLNGHIVVQITDPNKAKLFQFLGNGVIETVVVPNIPSRLIVQCGLQPGLAKIWENLLGFDYAGFHVRRWPNLTGLPFQRLLHSFPQAVPCGVARGGILVLNPDDTYVVRHDDEIVVIAENVDNYFPNSGIPSVPDNAHMPVQQPKKNSQMILFCGWHPNIGDMIDVLNALVPVGSTLWMFNEIEREERYRRLKDGGLNVSKLRNLKFQHKVGSTVTRRLLEELPLRQFDFVFIFAYNSLDDSFVDSRSFTTRLLIRQIELELDKDGSRLFRFPTIIEILDMNMRNSILASPSLATLTDQYFFPHELVGRMLALVARNRVINVAEDLFGNEGNELCFRHISLYLDDVYAKTSFYSIMARARQRGEIVIGYRLHDSDQVIINPPHKAEAIQWCESGAPECLFVVISRKSLART